MPPLHELPPIPDNTPYAPSTYIGRGGQVDRRVQEIKIQPFETTITTFDENGNSITKPINLTPSHPTQIPQVAYQRLDTNHTTK